MSAPPGYSEFVFPRVSMFSETKVLALAIQQFQIFSLGLKKSPSAIGLGPLLRPRKNNFQYGPLKRQITYIYVNVLEPPC